MTTQTLEVIAWAKINSKDNEVVKEFWGRLCEAVNEDHNSSAEKIYSEIRLYGSSTLLKTTRPEGVSYLEVAADVADKLAGWAFWQKSPYGYETIENCEKFVLEKMQVSDEDLSKLTKSVDSTATKKAVINGVKDGASDYLIVAGAAVTSALIARQIGLQIARQIVLQIARSLNIFLAALVVIDIAGPAYRRTIPSIIYTALLRKLYEANKRGM